MKADALVQKSSFYNPVLYLQLVGRLSMTSWRHNRMNQHHQNVPLSKSHARRVHLTQQDHTLFSSGHAGIQYTIKLVENKFWWPSYPEMSISQNLSSLCTIYFETSIHRSAGTPALFTSPMVTHLYIIHLPKLPTVLKSAKIIFSEVFIPYSLQEDIVSDRGVLFTSQV